MDPSGKKGIFIGYSEQSKAYRIYIPGYCQIEISIDVTFDEDATFNKSRKNHEYEHHEEEHEAPRVEETSRILDRDVEEEHILEYHYMAALEIPMESPHEMITHKRRPAWAREIIQDAEKYGAPEGTLKESKRPRPYSSYVALMCNLVDEEPTYFEEATQKKEWKNAMIE